MSCFTRGEKLLVLGTSLAVTGALAIAATRSSAAGAWLPLTLVVAPLITALSALAKRRRMSEFAVAFAAPVSALAASPAVVIAASGIVEAVKSGGFSYVVARNLFESLGASFWYVALAVSASMFLASLLVLSTAIGAVAVNDVDARLLAERASRALGGEPRWAFLGFLLGLLIPLVSAWHTRSSSEAQLYLYFALPAALLTSPLPVSLSFLLYAALPLPRNGLLLGATLGCAFHAAASRALYGRRAAAEGYWGLFQLALAALILSLAFFTLVGPTFPAYMLSFLLLSLAAGAAATSLESTGFSLSVALLVLLSQRLAAEAEALPGVEVAASWLFPLILSASLAALVQLHLRWFSREVEYCEPGLLLAAAPVAAGLLAIPYYAAAFSWPPPAVRRYEVSAPAVLLPLLVSAGGLAAQALARSATGSFLSLAAAAAPLHPSGMLLAALLGDQLRDPSSLMFIAGLTALKILLTVVKPGAVRSISGGASAGAGLGLVALALLRFA